MKVFREPVEEEEGGIASAPALRCHTQGETREEAEKNIHEAIPCCLEDLQQVGEEIPVEDDTIIKAIQVSMPA